MLKCKASSNRQPLHHFVRESSYHLHHLSISLLPLTLLLAFSIVKLYPLLRILLEPGNLPGEKKGFLRTLINHFITSENSAISDLNTGSMKFCLFTCLLILFLHLSKLFRANFAHF